jgi:PAS domain S-box-containing protein
MSDRPVRDWCGSAGRSASREVSCYRVGTAWVTSRMVWSPPVGDSGHASGSRMIMRADGPTGGGGSHPDPLVASTTVDALLGRLPDVAVLVFDRELRFTAAGGSGLARQGWDPEELLGRRLEEVVTGEEASGLADHYRAAIAGESRSFRHRGVRRPERMNAVDIVPLREADGTVSGGLVVARDVTDELNRVAALAHSERRQRQLSDSSVDMLALYDLEGMYLEVSQASQELFGWRPEELIGTSSYELFHPDDLAAIREVHQAVVAESVPRRLTYRLRCADGGYRWVEVNGHQITDPETGEVTAIQCTTRDITQRREVEAELQASEQRFRAALTHAPIGMALVDLDGGFLAVNDALCRIVGRTTEELLALTFQVITHPDDLDADLASLADLLAGRRRAYELEKRYLRADGSFVPCELHVSLIRDTDGRPMHFVSQIVDLSERKHVERQLRQLNAELRRSNAELERFATVTSHDLRSPLATLRGFLAELDDRGSAHADDQWRQIVHVAQDLTTQMAETIEGLLALARIGEGRLNVRMVDMHDLVADAVEALAPELEAAGADLRVGVLPEVAGDPHQLRLLFQNLIANAVRFREPRRRLIITLEAERLPSAWRFAVQDTGRGFDPTERDAIFDYSRRADEAPEGGGSGIGLATCRRIVERHGGHISAYTDARGARFEFTLPVP